MYQPGAVEIGNVNIRTPKQGIALLYVAFSAEGDNVCAGYGA